MTKLTKEQSKRHQRAMDLVNSDRALTWEDKWFVLENYHESQGQLNTLAGAFFTPPGLARDAAIEVVGNSVVDLCAGIGGLAFACQQPGREITCVEQCEEYVKVGKRLLPDANWIWADVFTAELGRFDTAISNPPFGAIKGDKFNGKYSGSQFEYKVIERASQIADYGVFILPQMSAPFRYSGERNFREEETDKCRKFGEQTGIVMTPNCGIDTSIYVSEWKGVSPICEVVCCDFEDPPEKSWVPSVDLRKWEGYSGPLPMFAAAMVEMLQEDSPDVPLGSTGDLFGGSVAQPHIAPTKPTSRRQRLDRKAAVERKARMAL
jgi:hypothetical protein